MEACRRSLRIPPFHHEEVWVGVICPVPGRAPVAPHGELEEVPFERAGAVGLGGEAFTNGD